MKVSVIVPTYNGAHKIGKMLHALSKQCFRDFELIVVIDGSTDGTRELLQSIKPGLPELRVIEQANGGRAKVRNRGAAEANGQLLIFFDDDMRPGPEAVKQHVAHHLVHPGSILTGGQIEEIVPEMSDFLRFKAGLSRKWAADLGRPGEPLGTDQTFLTAANCSMSKQTFEALGGFDERLTDAEDYDLAVRAQRAGIALYADPGILAWHDDVVSCASYIRRLRQYTAAQQRLVELKPELYGGATRYTAPAPTGLKNLFFRMLCSKELIGSIDKQSWTWLPATLRYRLYDYVITANGTYFPTAVAV